MILFIVMIVISFLALILLCLNEDVNSRKRLEGKKRRNNKILLDK